MHLWAVGPVGRGSGPGHPHGGCGGGDGGALTLRVQTQEVGWHLPRKGPGTVTLRYTLLLGTQQMSALRLELTLTKEEND